MRNPIKPFLPAVVTLSLAPWALAATVTIAELAPKDAAFIVGVDNFAAAKAAFDKTGFKKVWGDKKVQDFVNKSFKKEMEDFTRAFEDSGIKVEELDHPTGPAGGAFWFAWNPKQRAVEPRTVSFGDWGDKADATARQIEEAIARSEKDKAITLKEDEYQGAKLWVMEIIDKPDAGKPAAPRQAAEGDEEEMPDLAEENAEDESAFDMELKTLVYARAGNHLLLASDVETMERSLDRLNDKAADSVSETPDFTATVAQLDKPQGYAVMRAVPMLEMLDKLIDEAKAGTPGVSPMLADEPRITSALDAFGVTGVKALGMGFKFDTAAGMAEQSYAVLCPEKKGILSLFVGNDQKFDAPAFAGADAVGLSLMQFRFADILKVLTDGAKGLPPEFGDEMVQGIQQAQLMAGPILSNLGPQVWIVSAINKPFDARSSQMLFAIACKDAAQFNAALQNLGGMLPIQSRDFQGNQVWSLAAGLPVPGASDFALGVGFGHVFIGSNAMVENAMRSAGNPDAASLNKEPRFTSAIRPLAGNGMSFAWNDMKQSIEYADWTFKNADKIMEAQMAGMFGDDPDAEQYKKEMIEEAKKNQPEWMRELPLDVVAREMGDAVFEFHSVPEGFKGRSIWLRPVK